jgi:hypothetical protein
MTKQIKEAQAREITDLDRKNFAKYEAMFESGEKQRVLHGVDMTPQRYDWQKVARVDLGAFCNKPLSELHDVIDKLVIEHGEDAIMRTHSYESGGGWSMRADCAIPSTTYYELEVFKYMPVLTSEQRHAELQQFAIEYDEKTRQNTKERHAELLRRATAIAQKLKEADDPHAKRIKDLHERAVGKKKKKKK